MKAISLISKENVDMLASILSSVETRENRLWTMENEAYWAGTKQPIWAMTWSKAAVRM
jgi:hypothetical protein